MSATEDTAAEREPGWISRLLFGDHAGQPDPQLAERVRIAAKYGIPVGNVHIAGPCCGLPPSRQAGREAGA